jgi:uncharacterized protein YjbI with pentapeptide repeats
MKVIKPLRVGVLSKTFEHRREARMSVSLLAFRRFDAPRVLLTEAAMWKLLARELGEEALIDEGMPKSQPEWLVWGAAYAPAAKSAVAVTVTASVGPQSKTLRVLGDRYWRPDVDGVASDPQPFSEMPIRWSRAFGGPKLPNPYGRGVAAVKVHGGELVFLPNVENPSEPVRRPSDRPPPVSFAPMDATFPERLGLAGTYDDRWLHEHFPGLAEDVDWRFFGTAPADQRAAQFFQGDETFRFEGMHPNRGSVGGALAPMLARCFVHQHTPLGDVFREVPTRLETLWFFPHAECSVSLWRGVVAVSEYDGHDVLRLVVGADDPGAPRPVEHFEQVMWARLDKKNGAVAALRERDLVPAWPGADEGPDDDGVKAAITGDGLMEQNVRRGAAREIEQRRAMLVGLGLDPEEHGPKALPEASPPPGIEDLPAVAERAEAEARQLEAAERAAMGAREERIRATFAEAGMDFKMIEEERTAPTGGPPTFTARGKMAQLQQIAEESRARGIVIDEVEEMLRDEALWRRWTEAEQRMREAYRVTAHQGPPAARPPEAERARVRAAVEAALAEGRSLAGADLTGADLDDLDFVGVDLSGAFLECARMRRCDLSDANLRDAVLTRADLTGARLARVNLTGANLGGATLHRAWCEGADFTRAVLAKTALTEATLRGAAFSEADLVEAVFHGANLEGLNAERLLFMKTDLSGVNFRGATLPQAVFLECALVEADLTGATMVGATLQAARAAGLRAQGATLTNLRCVEGCDLTRADLRGAKLDDAQLRGAALGGADLSGANLDRADLSEADARGARFYHAHAWESRWVRADLSGALLVGADLLGAIMHLADLRGADLRGANLWSADLARVYSDASTQLAEANLGKVNIHPRRLA